MGSVGKEKDRDRHCIHWWWEGKKYKIRKVNGEWFWNEAHARKTLAIMQGEVDRGVFRIEAYLGDQVSDTVTYLEDWLEAQSLMPATYNTYRAAVRVHLIPFFTDNKAKLSEIQLDTVTKLLKWLQAKGLAPKYIWNIVNTLHACMTFAYRSHRIKRMPSFPRKGEFKLQKKAVEWITEDRQIAIIEAIPLEHQPIFWWLKYHYRRPGEAYALNREDYDPKLACFIIRRSTSARQTVDRTKTGAVHIVPCDERFQRFIDIVRRSSKDQGRISPAFFTCKSARNAGGRYTDTICHKLWKDACKKCGESIGMYAGLKHSSCTQFLMAGGTVDDLQLLTDHANRQSVQHYTGAVLERKRAAMARGKVVDIKERKNGR